MKTPLLTLLFIAALPLLGSQSVLAQSPWIPVPGAPNYFNGLPAGSFHIYAPQPNVLWGSFQSATVRGYNFQNTFRTLDNGQTWEQAGGGIELSAIDAQTAFMIDPSGLRRTVTGPRGFVAVAGTLPTSTQLIHFFNLSVGIAATTDSYGTPGPLFRTTDGGATWVLAAAAPATSAGAYNIYFHKRAIGNSLWLSTTNGDVLYTTDAGLTWAGAAGVGQVAFEDELHGLAYERDYTSQTQFLLRTVNGGRTWTPVVFSGQPLFNSITAVPGLPHTYLSVGYSSGFYDVGISAISRDNGTSWQVLATDNVALNEVVATSPTQIWAATNFNYRSGAPSDMLLRYGGVVLAAKNQTTPANPVAAYPNPTNGQMQLTGPLQGDEELRLYDMVGHLCQVGKVSDTRRTIDLSKQRPGLYHLTLTAANGKVRSLRVSRE